MFLPAPSHAVLLNAGTNVFGLFPGAHSDWGQRILAESAYIDPRLDARILPHSRRAGLEARFGWLGFAYPSHSRPAIRDAVPRSSVDRREQCGDSALARGIRSASAKASFVCRHLLLS